MRKRNYALETTGADASIQNSIVECGHCTPANMMCTMLHGDNLGSEYWTYALQHAVYIRNYLPCRFLPSFITSFEQFTSRRPDLTHLRVFRIHVTVKQNKYCVTKLDDDHTTSIIFLDSFRTNRSILFKDNTTRVVKNSSRRFQWGSLLRFLKASLNGITTKYYRILSYHKNSYLN